jgi:hypothetical protein
MTESPTARLRQAYADQPPGAGSRGEQVSADAAKRWRYDGQLEHTAAQLDAGHQLSPSQTTSVGFYLQDKAAAKAAGIDTSSPGTGTTERTS